MSTAVRGLLARRVTTGMRETDNSATRRPETTNFLGSRELIKCTVRMLSGWVGADDEVSQNLMHSCVSHY